MYKAISTKDPKSDIRSNIPEAFSTARLNIDTTPLMLLVLARFACSSGDR